MQWHHISHLSPNIEKFDRKMVLNVFCLYETIVKFEFGDIKVEILKWYASDDFLKINLNLRHFKLKILRFSSVQRKILWRETWTKGAVKMINSNKRKWVFVITLYV